MENIVKELKQMSKELQAKDEELSLVVREAGRQTQEGFERVIHAIHKMHNFVAIIPERLVKLAQAIKKDN